MVKVSGRLDADEHYEAQEKVEAAQKMSKSESESNFEPESELQRQNTQHKLEQAEKTISDVAQLSSLDKQVDSSHDALWICEQNVHELRDSLLQAQQQLKQKEEESDKFKLEQETLEKTRQSDIDVVRKHIMKMQKQYEGDMESIRSEKEALCEQHNQEIFLLREELERSKENARERGHLPLVKSNHDSDSEQDSPLQQDDDDDNGKKQEVGPCLDVSVSAHTNGTHAHGDMEPDIPNAERNVSTSSHTNVTCAHTGIGRDSRDSSFSRHMDVNMSGASQKIDTRIHSGMEGKGGEDSRHTDLNVSTSSQRSGTHHRQSGALMFQDMFENSVGSSYSPTKSDVSSHMDASIEVQVLLSEINTSRGKYERRIQTCQNEADLLRRQYEMKVVKLQQEMDELNVKHAAEIRDRDAHIHRLSMYRGSKSTDSLNRFAENHKVGADEGRKRVSEHREACSDEAQTHRSDTCILQDDDRTHDSQQPGRIERDTNAQTYHHNDIQHVQSLSSMHNKVERMRMSALSCWSRSLQRFLAAKMLLQWSCNVHGRTLDRCKNRAAEVRASVFVYVPACAF